MKSLVLHPRYLEFLSCLASESVRGRRPAAVVPMPEPMPAPDSARRAIPFLGVQRPKGLNDKALVNFSRGPEWDKRAAEIRAEREAK